MLIVESFASTGCGLFPNFKKIQCTKRDIMINKVIKNGLTATQVRYELVVNRTYFLPCQIVNVHHIV